jgi:hypothetical protein
VLESTAGVGTPPSRSVHCCWKQSEQFSSNVKKVSELVVYRLLYAALSNSTQYFRVHHVDCVYISAIVYVLVAGNVQSYLGGVANA